MLTSIRSHRGVRYSPSPVISLGGSLLEDRALTAPAFYRPPVSPGVYALGAYTKAVGTYVPDDTLAGPTNIYWAPTVTTTPGGAHFGSSQGSFATFSELAAGTLVDGTAVPPYSTTTTSAAEFLVHHGHSESGNSVGRPAGPLTVETEATGVDGWKVQDWEDATVTVDFLLNANVPSDYSYSLIEINFQSTYFGFTLVGDSTQATLTLKDGSGNTTSTNTSFFGPGGLGGEHEHFTVPAVAVFGATYDSYVHTDFDGSGLEPLQASSEQQFIDWKVSISVA